MLLILTLLATTAAAPAIDNNQDQDADFRIQEMLKALINREPRETESLNIIQDGETIEPQDRSDTNILESITSYDELNTQYKDEVVEAIEDAMEDSFIPESWVPPVHVEADKDVDYWEEGDKYWLLGATEQCGPELVYDVVTLQCVWRKHRRTNELQPEVVQAV